ncbi:MAG: hypothetical protein ACHQUC_02810 [Chlamydiales bacterium]
MVMKIDFQNLKEATSKFADDVASVAKDWYGRSVRFFKDLVKSGKIKDPGAGALAIVAAHIVLFQLAYRIANLLGEGNRFVKEPGGYRGYVGPLAWIMYGGGVFCFYNIVTVSLDPMTTFAMHITGFVLGILLTAVTDVARAK